jgi:hypothetical protein
MQQSSKLDANFMDSWRFWATIYPVGRTRSESAKCLNFFLVIHAVISSQVSKEFYEGQKEKKNCQAMPTALGQEDSAASSAEKSTKAAFAALNPIASSEEVGFCVQRQSFVCPGE